MRFLICEKQKEAGCDYSIGCGMKFGFVEASDMDEAINKVIYPDGRDEWCRLVSENIIEMMVIEEPSVAFVDVNSIRDEIAARNESAAITENINREMAELKRLQDKYPQLKGIS